jgi:iron complex transport system substrate-binding protein
MRRAVRALLLVSIVAATLVGGTAGTAAASHDGEDCSFPVSATDATGAEVTLDEPPEEVVVADAASAQTLWEIGAEDRIIGMPVRGYTAYLEGSENRTDVLTDDGTDLEVETIVDLDPDLVIAANPDFYSAGTVEQLREAGLTVYQYPLEESIEDIYAKMTLYGHLMGECAPAEATVDEMRAEVTAIEERVADRDRPAVLYYFFEYTAGEGTFTHDLITTAGGENVAASAGIEGFAPINDETIAERDPEWIVTTDDDGAVDTSREPLASTTAVQNDQVLRVDANLASQAGPRVVEPLGRMAEAFHPEATAEPTPTATAAPTPTHTATGPADGGATTEPTSGSGPGFGVVVSITLLVIVAGRAMLRGQ